MSSSHLLNNTDLLIFDDLIKFILKNKDIYFFLELKSKNDLLSVKVIDKIKKHNLWARIIITGFNKYINPALKLSNKYPKLKIAQLLKFPMWTYFKLPERSYLLSFGRLDQIPLSQFVFRLFFSRRRLENLKKYLESKNFNLLFGVINSNSGFEYVKKFEFMFVSTDNLELAIKKLN